MRTVENKWKSYLVFGVLIMVFGFGGFYLQELNKKDTSDVISPNNIYEESLVVVADKDYEPYSFYNDFGQSVGYDVEMIYMLADELKMNVDLRLVGWNEAINSLKTGEADLLLGLEYTPNEFSDMILSIPLHNDPFVVFSKSKFSNVSELYDSEIGVLNNSGSYTLFIKPYLLSKEARAYDSYSEIFAALENDEVDFAVARYSVGRRAVARIENSSIKASGPAIASNDFCIATGSNNEVLMEKVNKAIINLRGDGRLDELGDKWLGRYVEIIGIKDFVQIYKDVIILGGSVVALLIAFYFIFNYKRGLSLSKQREHELLERAARDSMTLLYSKNATEDLVTEILKESTPESMHAFIMMDIDSFKWVNDNLGHDFGDKAILEFVAGIKSVFAAPDIIGRVGGDEFTVFVKDIPNEEVMIKRLNKLILSLKRKVNMGEKEYKLSGSVGVCFYPKDGSSFAELYKHADEALYMAKGNGKGRFEIYK